MSNQDGMFGARPIQIHFCGMPTEQCFLVVRTRNPASFGSLVSLPTQRRDELLHRLDFVWATFNGLPRGIFRINCPWMAVPIDEPRRDGLPVQCDPLGSGALPA